MQHHPHIKTATRADADRLVDTLVLGFAADPFARWMFPAGCDYVNAIKEVFWSFGGRSALDAGTFRMLPDHSGYVTWLPPDRHVDDDALVAILQAYVPPSERPEVDEVLGRMAENHPHEPHWYLPIIVIDPAQQGKGLGALLLEDGLATCDEQHLVGYLESTSPRSAKLYERFGYRVLDEIQVGKSPPVYPMRREAR